MKCLITTTYRYVNSSFTSISCSVSNQVVDLTIDEYRDSIARFKRINSESKPITNGMIEYEIIRLGKFD